MFGKYGKGQETMPRVIHLSIARYQADLPKPGAPLEFLVTIHEEGTGISWQQNVTVDADTEQWLLATTGELYPWSVRKGLTPDHTRVRVEELGKRLYETFVTARGEQFLASIVPTAVLLDIDETILNLPWELIATTHGPISQRTPFGRLVATRVIPRRGRDPLQEDAVVRILAVINPTDDLAAAEMEISTLAELQGNHGAFSVEVSQLRRGEATRARFMDALAAGDYDILHFAGHAWLDPDEPEASALRLADGPLSASEVLQLPWKAAPYLVFNSACESGRAAGGRRLVSDESHANGLAAAFLAGGAHAYAGYFWPVSDTGASLFARVFYETLFLRENVGLAFLDARNVAIRELGGAGDLTGYSAVLFGDAASSHRRDLAMAV